MSQKGLVCLVINFYLEHRRRDGGCGEGSCCSWCAKVPKLPCVQKLTGDQVGFADQCGFITEDRVDVGETFVLLYSVAELWRR